MKFSEAIAKQEKALELMAKTFTNMKKKGLKKGNVESYMQGLEARWTDIRNLDRDIEKSKDESTSKLPYFLGWMEEAEEVFLEQRGLLLEALYECSLPPPSQSNENVNTTQGTMRPHHRKLPPVDLPKFSGNYTQWASFKDLFESIIGAGDLTEVERLQYLKSSLTGEAANLVKNIPTTNANFKKAWDKLVAQYENKRLIVNACLNSLFQLKPLTKESAQGLKMLKETTNDIVEMLTALGRPVKHWDDILTYLTLQRLDSKSRRDWETTVAQTRDPSTYRELEEFLNSRIQGLQAIEYNHDSMLAVMSAAIPGKTQPSKISNGKVASHTTLQQTQTSAECAYCKQPHYISSCANFKALDVKARKEFTSNNRLCYNCLGSHGVRDCRSKKSCYHCHGRHHSLLHFEDSPTQGGVQQKVEVNTSCTQASDGAAVESAITDEQSDHLAQVYTSKTKEKLNTILMATAQVMVRANGRKVLLRALLDPCSNASFIRESLVQSLRLPRKSVIIPVGGIGGGIAQTVKAQVSVTISPRFSTEGAWPVTALVLSNLTDYLPPRHCLPGKLQFLDGLPLADPHYTSDEEINMILGLDVYTHVILPGLRKNITSQVIAQETSLGWILSGKFPTSPSPPVNSHSTVTNEDLLQILHRFWEQEEIPSKKHTFATQEELNCENHYAQTVRRDKDGRYILKLPFNERSRELTDSYPTAIRMLQRMEKRFEQDEKFYKLYCDFIDEYLELGHAEVVDPASLVGKKVFYLPHHGVLKGSGEETKIWVVFNGSVKLAGPNLNDCLYAGPKLILELRTIVQLWRLLRYVWKTDMVKMFRQIWIDPEDRYFILIIFRKLPSGKIIVIRLKTVTYGLICAPYQALRTLKQLCQDEGPRFPQAKEVLENRTYMDDSYGGKNCLEEAVQQQREFRDFLMAGGFRLSKWAANHPQLLEEIPQEELAHSSPAINEVETHNVLGLSWQPSSDIFTYTNNWSIEESLPVTKRRVLAQTASLYDPLGWISPIVITFKIFLQALWHMGVQWDDEIPVGQAEEWKSLARQLVDLSQVRIPRQVGDSTVPTALELHGFADASEKAMAAVIYLRVLGENSSSTCNILIAKTKVAPLKQVSLPRLELSAACMLANLMKDQVDTLSFSAIPKFLWSDSTVALSWIKGHPTRWTTYVANRVSSIQTAVPDASWSHVAGALNPADIASRGTTVTGFLAADYWVCGPEFLRCTNAPWKTDSNFTPLSHCPEERKMAHFSAKAETIEWELLSRYSSWHKLLLITARCLKFTNILKQRIGKISEADAQLESEESESLVLTPHELQKAEEFWVKHVQNLHFAQEVQALKGGKEIRRNSKLLMLNPIIDVNGLLRVGGRLKHSTLNSDQKTPISYPKCRRYLTYLFRIRIYGHTTVALN